MGETAVSVNQTRCDVVEIRYSLPAATCARCQRMVSRFATAGRTAIDVNVDHPVLLHVRVSVHYCPDCHHYFRVQPPFLRPDAIYTHQVVQKAVQSVYEDGMAMRRVTARLARDFWVCPSEGSVRSWCRSYGAGLDFAADYQPWVVSRFSGILCVDEVYQDQLALLLAVDPAAPKGDRLVGYQLVHGSVDATDVAAFLTNLKAVGIEPEQVITDGSQLYPTVLAQVWPQAAHQLCLFHETRRVTTAVMKTIQAIQKGLPQPLPAVGMQGGGQLRSQPPSDDLAEPAVQRWYFRQAQRRTQIAEVHQLAQQGLALRAIARQTGHHYRTIKRWLAQLVPSLPKDMPAELLTSTALPAPRQRKARKAQQIRQVHRLAQQGASHAAIARQMGVHRVTVAKWLHQAPPPVDGEELTPAEQVVEQIPPPAPWSNWAEVRQVREALREHRFLLLRRPEHLKPEEQQQVEALLASPVGSELQVARTFLVDWYRLWTDEAGQRRTLAEAQVRYEAWRTLSGYAAVPQLRRVQAQMTPAKFERLSPFLRHPHWEATNNGVERAGRGFRHRQASHFNLRSQGAITNAIIVAAFQQKETTLTTTIDLANSSTRGRKPLQIAK